VSSSQGPRRDRPLAEQHEEWTAHLRRHVVSRRTMVRGAIGAAAGSLLLGPGLWPDRAVASVLAATGTVAGGFLVNGRHLSFGNDPRGGAGTRYADHMRQLSETTTPGTSGTRLLR
jgi:hypothetical protein